MNISHTLKLTSWGNRHWKPETFSDSTMTIGAQSGDQHSPPLHNESLIQIQWPDLKQPWFATCATISTFLISHTSPGLHLHPDALSPRLSSSCVPLLISIIQSLSQPLPKLCGPVCHSLWKLLFLDAAGSHCGDVVDESVSMWIRSAS